MERVRIFELLITNKGKLTTSQITEYLNTTAPTARRTMTELKATGLVDMVDTGYSGMEITLKDKFSWFLHDKFKELKTMKEKELPRRLNPILLLLYYSIINKKQIEYGDNLSQLGSVCGGHFSFTIPEENNGKKHTLYWSSNIGKWGCNDGNQKGDKFDMQGVCKGK